MRKNAPSHTISGVFVFLLLGIFAVFSTVMVLLGARAYRNIAEQADGHNAARLSTAYVRSMIRSDDEENAVAPEDVNGIRTITMRNVYDEEEYITRIYVYDGMLREWFASADLDFEPENGEAVCAADEMAAELNGPLLTVRVRSGNAWHEVNIALRCAAEN